jgi:hypothetical protein
MIINVLLAVSEADVFRKSCLIWTLCVCDEDDATTEGDDCLVASYFAGTTMTLVRGAAVK